MIDSHIFRAYDIRGDVRTQLTPDVVYIIGRALGAAHFEPGKTLVIGRDARSHSPELAEQLIDGLRTQGVNIIDIGQITTPMLYFALNRQNYDGGVMLTGSHNPVWDNGLKICKRSESFRGDDIRAIREMTENLPEPASVRGSYSQADISDAYISEILERVKPGKKLKIVADSGNGVAGPFVSRLLSNYASELIELYSDPDGSFPNHHPDPSVAKNLVDCQKAVLENHADIGVAFDGDGDRLGVVDRDGTIIPADHLIVLFAREILGRRQNVHILGDVKCSKFTFDDIANHGGIPVMTKTGHALIKARIRETDAALAGEMSGHFFFGDRWFGFDDALNAAARILEIASNADGKSLNELISDLPQSCATPEIRIDCPDDLKFDLSRAMYELYKERYPTSDLDGARIDFPKGWALIRASNTQPVLVMRVEADSQNSIDEILADLRGEIEKFASSRGYVITV